MPPLALHWDRTPARPAAVVLVLHGGRKQSELPTTAADLTVVRMLPIARSIARAGRGRLAVARLRYAVRGWNGVAASPLGDGRRALDAMAERYPDVPIALVGHSMGGRVALRLGEDERVTHVIALAPWVGAGDTFSPHADLRLLVIHGANDRVTSPQDSRHLVERLQARGWHASFVGLRHERHAMLQRWRTWDRLTAGFLRRAFQADRAVTAGGEVERLGARAASERLMTII
jgi:alpha-beta hydrolase superfamily lysophospholipase